LTLSRRFCELLGGSIRATSQLGRGSTFTVVLPAELPAAVTEPVPAHTAPAAVAAS
jgi:signal transduction histidine kinase